MKKKYIAAAAAVLMVAGALTSPVPADAFDLGGIVQSAAQGLSTYKQVDKQLDYLDNTDEGRQEVLQAMQKDTGVANDWARTEELRGIMENLSNGIAASDPSIRKKPFIYYLSPSQEFNAACSYGHVMVVNEGIFRYLTSEDEIATVLGHEMGHGMKNHVANSVRKKIKTEVGASILAGSIDAAGITNVLINLGVNQLETVTISRGDEWEADNLAFDYIYHAGYNPGASAATWQRFMEREGDNKASVFSEVFSPSDHPSNSDRRDNYVKKLVKLSKDHVTVDPDSNAVRVNKKVFVMPAPAAGMSGAERKYFVMGNLAAAYDHGENKKEAYVKNGTVYLGNQAIMTPANGDPSAEELAAKLNKIK